jgi:hypothetical protein
MLEQIRDQIPYAVELVTAYALALKGKAVKQASDATMKTGKTIYGWLKERLAGHPKTVLDEVVEKEHKQEELRACMKSLCAEDEVFAEAFQAFMKDHAPATNQSVNIGAGSTMTGTRITQINGNNNTVS